MSGDMAMPNDQQQQLERLVEKTLRAQRLRAAPPDLQMRVLHEIGRRQRSAWWRKDFLYWPGIARIGFAVSCIVIAYVAADTMRFFEILVPPPIGWLKVATTALASVGQRLPLQWIYGAAALLLAMYAMLFGLSAAAYRTLYANR